MQRIATLILACGLGCSLTWAEAPAPRGAQLRVFESTWEQRIPSGEEWVPRGEVDEVLEPVEEEGRALWLRTQTAHQGPVSFINRSYFDRKTLRPVRFEREIAPDVPAELLPRIAQAGFVPRFRVVFDGTTYRTIVTDEEGKEKTTDQGSFDEVAYDGAILGLVIAALPLSSGYTAQLPVAFITPQDGSVTRYLIEATVAGQEAVGIGDGKKTDAWRVDVAWLDADTKEVTSPGGPDAAGGAYYVLTEPAKGLPHVPKYRNDNVDFELKGR